MPQFIAWHGRNLTDHTNLRNQWYAQGYRFVTLSIYGAVTDPVYAAVMVKEANPVTQHDFSTMTATQWQQTFNSQASQGFGPIILCATGTGDNPLFAAVFEAQNSIPFTQHGLTLSDFQNAGSNAKTQGLILRWAASYGSGSDSRFAGIWAPNTDNTLWNNDGLQDSASDYQSRFNAETAAWCRPSFVTLNGDNQYLSVFVANEIGPYWARHGMTPNDYQNYFDTYTAQGFYPVVVQAAGADAASARFAALFNKTSTVITKQFTATGPIANAAIDAAVQQIMTAYPVARQASLAIVRGRKLVYARGYTMAEAACCPTHDLLSFGERIEDSYRARYLQTHREWEAGAVRYHAEHSQSCNAGWRSAKRSQFWQYNNSASFGTHQWGQPWWRRRRYAGDQCVCRSGNYEEFAGCTGNGRRLHRHSCAGECAWSYPGL
jgi:hypothetical protein